jgi:hypothetical protein
MPQGEHNYLGHPVTVPATGARVVSGAHRPTANLCSKAQRRQRVLFVRRQQASFITIQAQRDE